MCLSKTEIYNCKDSFCPIGIKSTTNVQFFETSFLSQKSQIGKCLAICARHHFLNWGGMKLIKNFQPGCRICLRS